MPGKWKEVVRLAFKGQLNQDTKRHLLAVQVGTGLGNSSQPVVNGVRRRQSRRFEAQTGKKGVRFHKAIQTRRDGLSSECCQCVNSVFKEGPVAQLGECQGASSRGSSSHVSDVALHTGPCFEPCGESVTHSRHQQPDRTLHNHLRIYKNQIRISTEEPALEEDTIIGVDDGESAARCVARSDCGAIHHWKVQVCCHCPCRIKCLASTCTDNYSRLLPVRLRLHTLDLSD